MADAASAPTSVKRGRKEGTPSWVPIEDVIAYIACNHADEKFAESGKDERALNAKTFFDSEIVKMPAFELWTPSAGRGSGPKEARDSVRLRDGEQIYSRGKNLRTWLQKLVTEFELLWLNHNENGPCYNRSKSGMDDLEWWHDCEVKGLEQVKAKAIDPRTGKPKTIPKGLTLAFRYVCPDSPYTNDGEEPHEGVPVAVRKYFSTYTDRRYFVDPRIRLDESNKGPSRDDQRSLAAATAALGADPRTPRPLVMGTPQDDNAAARYQRLATAHFARTSWGFQKLMEMNGVDFTGAPPIPEDVADILAPVPAPLTAPNPATNPATNPSAAASESGDTENPTTHQPSDCEADDAEGAEESPPSPPSPAAMAAAQRRATRAITQHDAPVREKSTRARKAPRRH